MTDPVSKGQICKGCPRYENRRCGSGDKSGHVQVLFIAEQPDDISASTGTAGTPFRGHGGKVVRSALDFLTRKHTKYAPITYAFTYAAQCVSLDDSAPNKEVLHHCQPNLQSVIKQFEPKVIVAMGATALRQLGVKQQYSDSRNKFLKHYSYEAPIYVSFSEKALLAAPGVFETFKLNLTNIFDRVLNASIPPLSLEELSKDYQVPKTMDEALAVCDMIRDHRSGNLSAEDSHISVDTETNTLYAEKATSKIIAFCFGYDDGKAATLLYDHPNAGAEYLRRLPELTAKIKELLASRKPKIFHNAKFDLKFIELKYGMPVNEVFWDTLLGEHLLDEDKKGNYGLKVLTANHIPQYGGYEDKLYDLLEENEIVSKADEAGKELEDLRKIIATEHPGFLKELEEYKDALVIYEVEKVKYDAAMREHALAVENYHFCKDYLAGLQAAWSVDIENWQKGKRGRPKKPVKWFTKPEKPETLKEPKHPKDPRTKKEQQISKDAGFENIPVHDLQVYGAVDGDVTRQLANIQLRRIFVERSKVRPLMRTHAIPASRVLGRMEYEGTRVDQAYIGVLEDALSIVVRDTEQELHQMVATTKPPGLKSFSLNGAQTLGNVLYNWGWVHPNGNRQDAYEIRAVTKTNQPSTSEKVLRQFVSYEDDKKTIPTESAYFIERLLRYRKASKARNTFLANVRALSKRDGFLHTQFHLNGTGTGRLSCVAPSTILDTSHGRFKIADPALQQFTDLRIRTHTGKQQRILAIFPKGKEQMYRVVDSDGNTIECTKKHRFNTPTGWHALGELHPEDQLITYNYYTKDFVITTLRVVEAWGIQEVWDLSVEEDESYIAQGFVNHNSSDMNMQNVPKYLAGWNLKKLFIPDNDNYLIVNVDYKGAEVRVFTAYARDEALIKALNDGLDMHSFFAAQVFKRPYEMYARRDDATFIPDKNLRRLLDVERSNIKRVVFGILYGAGPEKISETIGVSVEEAKALIGLLYQMFPEIQKYAEIVEMEVAQNHFVDTHFGRRRRFPLAAIARHAGRAKRQGRNFKIQSTSSDIVLGQLIEMDAPLRSEFGGRMLLTVHDSLVFQFPKKYIHQLRPFVKEYAEARVTKKYPWLPVPFAADVEVGDNYGECQSIDKYVAQNPIILQEEGIVEEHELLTELRLDAFEAA